MDQKTHPLLYSLLNYTNQVDIKTRRKIININYGASVYSI